MPRILAAILLVAVLAIGGVIIATTAYQAGLSTAVTTASASGAVVAPVVVPAYGYGYGFGWHPGFGLFGFLGALFFLFIVFALVRAIFWRGGPGRRGGWGGYGPGGWGYGGGDGPGKGPNGQDHGRWDSRAQAFDEWHRRAHGETPPADPTDATRQAGPTGTA
jgi:hypothetical protein